MNRKSLQIKKITEVSLYGDLINLKCYGFALKYLRIMFSSFHWSNLIEMISV